MNLIILGAPGSGKGTQADLLCKKFNLFHISGGAALRREIASGSEKGRLLDHIMSKGELVPFETICSVTNPEMLANKNNFVLDGTPRDLAQAEYLTDFFKENKIELNHVIYLHVPDEKLIERLLLRSKTENRHDDTPQSIKERFVVFHNSTEPVISYYKSLGILTTVDGDRIVEEIATDMEKLVSSYER